MVKSWGWGAVSCWCAWDVRWVKHVVGQGWQSQLVKKSLDSGGKGFGFYPEDSEGPWKAFEQQRAVITLIFRKMNLSPGRRRTGTEESGVRGAGGCLWVSKTGLIITILSISHGYSRRRTGH